MCFAKSSPAPVVVSEPKDPVIRHEADASLTKNSKNNIQSGFQQNVKTSALGLDEQAKTSKKTLLGE